MTNNTAKQVATFTIALTVLSAAEAQLTPVYFNKYRDAVTGDNAFNHGGFRYWDVDAGADRYQNDFYERPTVQTYADRGGRYAAEEYFEYLDITEANLGFDNRYLYVSITHFGLDKSTKDGVDTKVGLAERYGFRIGKDQDGRRSSLFVVDQPGVVSNPFTFKAEKTFGYRDGDGDVGGRGFFNGGLTGLNITKSDNALEEVGMNGYDQSIISDGKFGNSNVLFARLKPGDETTVEFALDYVALGWSKADLFATKYLEFESIKGGPKDPQNYLWNDKYTKLEAGSPNAGANGLSEFGTQGLGNIYELDTVRGDGVVPEPATMLALGVGLAALVRRRKNR